MKNKLLKTNYKKLRISLFLVSLLSCLFITTAYSQGSSQTTTTTNLTPQSFTTTNGWSGTNLSSTHGNGTIAGVSGQSIENTISLTNVGLSQAQINEGFTSTQGADIWFWSGNQNQNVTMTQILTGSNGEVITQNKTIPYASSYYNTYSNIVIVDKNTQVNYNITSKFSFYESTNSLGHVAADLKNPTLSITYITDPTPPIVIAPITTLVVEPIVAMIITPVVAEIITPVVEIIESPIVIQQAAVADMREATPILFTNPEPTATVSSTVSSGATTLTTPEPTATVSSGATTSTPSETTSTVSSGATTSTPSETTSTTSSGATTLTSSEATSTKESNANTTSSTQETASSGQTTDTKTESSSEKSSTSTTQSAATENTKTEGSSSKTSSSENVSNEKGSTTASGSVNTSNATSKDEKINVSVKAAVDKVERELKSIGDKTKAIQEIKLDGIKAGSPNLGTYENRAFYEPKYYNGVPNPDFYLQADIAQKPVYANVTLAAYTNNDPIGKQQAAMQEIQDEMNDIIIQLEQLKRK